MCSLWSTAGMPWSTMTFEPFRAPRKMITLARFIRAPLDAGSRLCALDDAVLEIVLLHLAELDMYRLTLVCMHLWKHGCVPPVGSSRSRDSRRVLMLLSDFAWLALRAGRLERGFAWRARYGVSSPSSESWRHFAWTPAGRSSSSRIFFAACP